LSSGSSKEQKDHQKKDNSDDENDDMFKQNEHMDNVNEERPIGANSDKWKMGRKIHREVNKII
jgi:hypothetical protein